MGTFRPYWLFAMTLLTALPSNPAMASKAVTNFGKEKNVTIEDYRPRLMDDEGYHEEWSISVYMEDGSYAGIDFIISNVGIGDLNGAVRANYSSKPNNKKVKCVGSYDDDEWSYSKRGAFSLKFGKNRLTGDLKGLKATVKCKKMTMELEFKNVVPPCKPGSGVLRFGKDDGEYSMMFPSPRARVTGIIKTGGKTFELKGTGHASHSRTTMYPHDQFRRWFRFKKISEQVSIIMAEVETESPYNHSTRGWVLVLDSNGRIIASGRTNFVFDSFIKDTKSEEGYKIPRRVRFAAVDGKTEVAGVLLMKDIKKISDPTADLGALKRAFVRRYTKPKDYRINCDYKIRVKTGEDVQLFQGKGNYQFMYVNP